MRQLSGSLGFAFEACQHFIANLGIEQVIANGFDGDNSFNEGIPSLVDYAHGSFAELCGDSEVGKCSADHDSSFLTARSGCEDRNASEIERLIVDQVPMAAVRSAVLEVKVPRSGMSTVAALRLAHLFWPRIQCLVSLVKAHFREADDPSAKPKGRIRTL